MNNFSFIAEILGNTDLFWLRLPTTFMFGVAILSEWMHVRSDTRRARCLLHSADELTAGNVF